MSSVFSRIVRGEIPSWKIAETAEYYAFLDVSPLAIGHALVIPKKEISYIFAMEEAAYQGLFLFAKSVAVAIEKSIPCKRIGLAVIGLEVPHVHIHLIPINEPGDINFAKPKLKVSDVVFRETAEMIRRNFQQL